MEIRNLNTFLQVVSIKNFTQAAKILDVYKRQEFEKRGISKVWKYGIAFCGKQVHVKMKI